MIYYAATRQRVRLILTPDVVAEAERAVSGAKMAARGPIPAPLEDSPKCPGCSLVGICLPDETNLLAGSPGENRQLSLFEETVPRRPPARVVRPLITPRAEQRPVYLNSQGLRVGKSGEVLQVREKETVVQEVRMGEICQVNLMGNIQITTQAVQQLCQADIPICYFSQGGWFYAITSGMGTKNIFLRKRQFRMAVPPFAPQWTLQGSRPAGAAVPAMSIARGVGVGVPVTAWRRTPTAPPGLEWRVPGWRCRFGPAVSLFRSESDRAVDRVPVHQSGPAGTRSGSDPAPLLSAAVAL
jgi:hypothetical protein